MPDLAPGDRPSLALVLIDDLEGVEPARAEPAVVQPLTVIGSYRLF